MSEGKRQSAAMRPAFGRAISSSASLPSMASTGPPPGTTSVAVPIPAAAKPPKVKDPLRLKAFKRHPNGRAPRLPIDFANNPLAAALRAEVEAMNAFAAATRVEGCLPPRWFRQFNGDFRLFGRFCAAGPGNYQSMPAADRLRAHPHRRRAGRRDRHPRLSAHLPARRCCACRCPKATSMRSPASPARSPSAGSTPPSARERRSKVAEGSAPRPPELHNHPARAVMAAALARYPFLAEPWRVAEELPATSPNLTAC